MAHKTHKDKIHILVVRDSRHPVLIEPTDVSKECLESGIVTYGSQSASGDFNPYHIIYKDILGHFQVLKFSQLGVSLIGGFTESNLAFDYALRLSNDNMAASNYALNLFGATKMSLKCLISKMA
jgi:hypothetical protein